MPTIAEKWMEDGMQRGIQQGMQQGMLKSGREAVLDILEVRFDAVPESIIKVVTKVDEPEVLKHLHKKAATIASLEEFKHLMKLVLDRVEM